MSAELALFKRLGGAEKSVLKWRSRLDFQLFRVHTGSSAMTRVAPPAARALQKQEADIHTPDSTDSAQPSYMEVRALQEE